MDPRSGARETSRTKVLVIGAGQAGLAAAHELKKAGFDFLLVDAGRALGDSWRRRYDALTLFTPRSISRLPEMSLHGDPHGYATKDEFADYLVRYADERGHRAIMDTQIESLRRTGKTFEAATSHGGTYLAEAVIVATGAFQKPRIPPIQGLLSF